jgi:hypothetical protein
MEPTALREAVLYLLKEKLEESQISLKSCQNEMAKGHDIEITLGETLAKIRHEEELVEKVRLQEVG